MWNLLKFPTFVKISYSTFMYLCLKSNSLIGKKSVLFSGRSFKTENAGFTIISVKYHENQVDFFQIRSIYCYYFISCLMTSAI